MSLDDRKKLILKAVVDDYISTAEPVGSKALAARNEFMVSSATIRNEMAELEEEGYLIHPHTSAGRIPTDKGYRVYVDNLMQVTPLDDQETQKVREFFDSGFEEITAVLESASHALAQSTGYTSVTLTPRMRHSQLKQIKMLMIEPGRVLMVVVLEEGIVKDRLVRVSDVLTDEQLYQISKAVESGLSGMPIEEITFIALTTAGKKVKIPESLLNQILYEAYVSIKQADNLGIYMDGSNKMLGYPEFSEISKARSFMDTLAEHGMVAGYLDEVNKEIGGETVSAKERRPYMIRIGQEIALNGFRDCSFVTTTYGTGRKIAGSISVIGPKRMDYSKVVSSINFVRMHVNREIRKICAGSAEENQ